MKRRIKKISLGCIIAYLSFWILTIVLTFFGVELLWTSHRGRALMVPDSVETTADYWFLENSVYGREERTYDDLSEYAEALTDMSEVYKLEIFSVGYDNWITVSSTKEDSVWVRGILNLYAKKHNLMIYIGL